MTSSLLEQPIRTPAPLPGDVGASLPAPASDFARQVFGDYSVRQSLITQYRGGAAPAPGADLVFGSEGQFRVTTDVGNLLGKSPHAPGVITQQRTPITGDPRVRANRYGPLLASGSYWAPARPDLDTLLSRIDSRLVRDIVVVKGPYSAQLGPGFSFIDFQLWDTPRYEHGSEWHGSTSLEYKLNGQQLYGRQAFWGGGSDWGFRVGYGQRVGNDYSTGSEAFDVQGTLPSSYNWRDFDFALGYNFSPDSQLEFKYLREVQSDVEFPGLVFDINTLVANGYELKYSLKDQPEFDLWTVEGWYNRTSFTGDTRRAGKHVQIPTLREIYSMGPADYLTTDVDGMSSGYRTKVMWGAADESQLTVGTDLIRIGQQLNDLAPSYVLAPPLPPFVYPARNYPIPRSHSTDLGLFAEYTQPCASGWTVHTGTRLDVVMTDARNNVPGMGNVVGPFPPVLDEQSLAEMKQSGLDQQFFPVSLFALAEYQVNNAWTVTGGAGYAVRPPTLTELYSVGPYIGSLQPGLTYVEGDPQLDPERRLQVDAGVRMDYGATRARLNAFYAWVFDYITYDDVGEQYQFPFAAYRPSQDLQHVAFVNTELATLTGFELTADRDFGSWLTGFAVMSYVEGWDHDRTTPARMAAIIRGENGYPTNTPRSWNGTLAEEPLPGIPPLEARLGLRWHEPVANPDWVVELEARMVDGQDQVAATLFEAPTPGFTVWNVRGYYRPFEGLSLYAGVENLTNRFYREHLDYRTGRGIWQPGLNMYFATELVY